MARRYRRKKNNALNIFFTIILLLLIGILCYKIYNEQFKPKYIDKTKTENTEKVDNKTKIKEEKIENKEETKDSETKNNETKANEVTTKSSANEKTEVKNETNRRGGNITLELIGDENVTVSKGSSYKDAGFKATYSDGTDASAEVEVENAVDTSKAGDYTVSYYAGNAVIIRRVTVK